MLKKRLSVLFKATLASLLLLVPLQEGAALGDEASGLVYPVMSPRKSSTFGPRIHPIHRVRRHHNGVDLAAPEGALIRAIKAGTVVFADPHGGYGNLIVVSHTNGYTSHYGHCSEIRVQPGDRVNAGQIIGTVGATGAVTGPHLHFEIRKDGEPRNPEDYIPGLAKRGKG